MHKFINDEVEIKYKHRNYYVSGIVVSHDSTMIAIMDSHCAVSLL